MPPTRLDASDSDSPDDSDSYDFDSINNESSARSRKTILNSGQLGNVEEDTKEEQDDYAGAFNKSKASSGLGFGFSSGYSMKVSNNTEAKKEEESSPGFKKGYKMSMQ